MSKKLFQRLESYRKKHKLSIMAFCRQLDTSHVNYHRWKNAGSITGPYKKIIETFLDVCKSESLSAQLTSSKPESANTNQGISDIAVIGMSCFYPGAHNVKELWENILSRRVQFRRMLDQRLPLSDYYDENVKGEKSYLTKAAFIDGFEFDWSKWRIPKKVFESTDIVHWLALDTALKAFEDAGYKSGKDIPFETTGAIVGNTLTGEQTRSQSLRLRWPFVQRALYKTLQGFAVDHEEQDKFAQAMEEIYKSAFYPITEDSLAGGLANTIAGRICNYFNLNGGGYIVDGACSSSLLAVATAVNALKSGDMDLALAGGVDISLDPFELVGFSKAGALTKDQMRVYDRRGAGFLPGEGCGFIVLKRLADAERDKDQIYAVIKGCGISSDGKGGIMEPSSQGQAYAIGRAYKDAGYTPAQLDFVEGHGTGTTRGDEVELGGIALAIENSGGGDLVRSCGVTSFKSVVGHTKAAAGIGGLLKAIMAVNQRVLPPIANCYEPHQIFEKTATSIYPAIQGHIFDKDKKVRAGVSAAGFGGINCHVTLESYDKPTEKIQPAMDERALLVSAQQTEVFVFSSKTAEHLKRAIIKFKEKIRFISHAEMADFACWLNTQSKKHALVKVAVVTDTPEHLYEAMCAIEKFLDENTVEPEKKYPIKVKDGNTRIVIGNGIKKCRVGFLYPGQASQKLNMTRHVFERYNWARDFAKHVQLPVEKFLYQPLDKLITDSERQKAQEDLNQVEVTQAAVVLSCVIWTEFLSKLGIEPEAVGGHSLGELPAFYKAGAYDAETLLKFAEFRGKVMSSKSAQDGGMISVFCSVKEAEDLIKDIKGIITVANINASKQIIVSGEKTAVKEVERLAKEKDIRTLNLPVSNAFHSPLMDNASQKTAKCDLIKKSFTPKGIQLFSGMLDEPVRGKIDLQEYFSKQVISKVNFINMAQGMMKECDVLIEAGPGRILSGLVKQINKDLECFSVESFPENDADLNVVLAEMFIRGKDVHFEQLYKNRLIRPFVSVSRKKFIVNQCERPLKDFAKVQSALGQRIGDVAFEEKVHVEPSDVSEAVAPDAHNRIDQILVEQVCHLTGFEKESISMDLRLLDDLNLDSIKAAELIGKVAQILGIAGEVDPSQHSNKKLAEIRDILFESAFHSKRADAQAQSPSAVLQRYLDKRWVRDFVVKYEPQELKKTESTWLEELKTISIVCEDEEKFLADMLKKRFLKIGIKVSIHGYDEDLSQAQGLISILPKPKNGKDIDAEALKKTIERLHKTASFASQHHKDIKAVVFVQFGNGSFGEEGAPVAVSSSCAKALASTLHLEWPELKVKVLDFDAKCKDADIAKKVLDEFGDEGNFSAVGYDAQLVRKLPVFVHADPVSYKKRKIPWDKDDVVIVTGGAKGITSECAFAFAQKYHTQMVLIGRSQISETKNDEISRTIGKFKEAGLKAAYFSTDVTKPDVVASLIDKVQKKYGKVTGVIHGAGLNSVKRLKNTNTEDAYKESRVKVLGAVDLIEALEKNDLKMFAGLTSVIGVTGMEGSGWYGFANESLNLYLRNYQARARTTQVISLAYSVWDEIGMGVKLGTMKWLAGQGISAIPVDEGVKHFMQLVDGSSGSQQTVVISRTAGLDTWRTQSFDVRKDLRFVEEVKSFLPKVELIAQCRLNTQDDSYVSDHNWKGSLLFPLVFGLEAMAQAYSYVTGIDPQGQLKFSDVKLDRPIPVDEQKGTVIEIHAVVLEKDSKKDTEKVKVDIYCQQTGFKEPHFSAVVSTAPKSVDKKVPKKIQDAAKKDIDLDMKTDVYGPVLFQGGDFQCIEKLHQLYYDEKTRKGECVFTSGYNKSAPEFLKKHKAYGGRFMIGDPFFLDSLLQSMQLIIPQDESLPNHIGEVVIASDTKSMKNVNGKADIFKIDDEQGIGNVDVISDDGLNLSVKDFHLRIFKTISERPSANELADPNARTQRKIDSVLAEAQQDRQYIVPVIRCLHDSRLVKSAKSLRHEIEKPLIQETVNKFLIRESKEPIKKVRVKWRKDGKPVLENKELSDVGLSLSHDGDLLVCAVGIGDQGIDIETVVERSKSEWRALLGNKKYKLFQENVAHGIDINEFGTTLWSAIEVVKKVKQGADEEISFLERKGAISIYKSGILEEKDIIGVIPIGKIQEYQRVLSILVSSIKDRTLHVKSDKMIIKNLGYEEVFDLDIGYGPQEQLAYVKRFPVVFKNIQNLSRSVYFTNYFDWMGNVREYALYPIIDQIKKYTETGQWGIATNNITLKILGELKIKDTVEVSMWMEKSLGDKNSTFDWVFDWRKLLPNGEEERVAISTLRTTWVQIMEHGEAKVRELPQSLKEFMDIMGPKTKSETVFKSMPEPLKKLTLGELIFKKDFHKEKYLLHEEIFKTSLEESNLVGNIYFSNYAKWLGKTQDLFFKEVSPEYFEGLGDKGEFFSLNCEVNYLQEAMPFDTILVKMYLDALYANGMGLYFEFFKLGEKGALKKLAFAKHKIVLGKKDRAGIIVLDVPKQLRDVISIEKIKCGN